MISPSPCLSHRGRGMLLRFSDIPLTLPLLVLGVLTDYPDNPAPFHNFAFFTSYFYGSSYFHFQNLYLVNLLPLIVSLSNHILLKPVSDSAPG
jgi:hypothetical protein